jgi:hypothetical protein
VNIALEMTAPKRSHQGLKQYFWLLFSQAGPQDAKTLKLRQSASA